MTYKITIHGSARRPWGIETLVTVDDDGQVFNFAVCTEKTPTRDDLETQAIALTEKQQQIIADKALRSEDVDTLEAQKQTLIDDIADLEDQKAQLEAEVK